MKIQHSQKKKKEKVLEVWFLVRTLWFSDSCLLPMSSDDISSVCVQRDKTERHTENSGISSFSCKETGK